MSAKFFWQLPVQGDGRSVRRPGWVRGDYGGHAERDWVFARTGKPRDGYHYFDYLAQVAGAANLTRFDGVWIPQSEAGEEPLITAGAFVREARHLTFVPSLRAPLISAVYSAKIANSFQRLSGGRLALHLHSEEDRADTWHGRHWSRDEQLDYSAEFLDVFKGFWADEPFTYEGRHFLVENGGFPPALAGQPIPEFYLSGLGDKAFALSARHADVHVLDLAPLDEIRDQVGTLTRLAAAQGRTLAFALRTHVVARSDAGEAWELLRGQWEGDDFDAHIRGERIWAGFDDHGAAPVAGLVGSYQDIIDEVRNYAGAGISRFIFSARPALEEVYRFAEKVLPFARIATSDLKQAV